MPSFGLSAFAVQGRHLGEPGFAAFLGRSSCLRPPRGEDVCVDFSASSSSSLSFPSATAWRGATPPPQRVVQPGGACAALYVSANELLRAQQPLLALHY